MEDSPAAAAGLQEEDIIVEFNGQDIERSGELPQFVGRAPVGEPSRLTVVRSGKKKKLSVTIGELPDQRDLRVGSRQSSKDDKFGLSVRDLSDQTKEQLGIDDGVEVVNATGIAARSGLMARDVILRMRTRPVANTEALNDILDDVEPGSIVPVLVLRQQRRIFLTLKVPEDD